MNRGSFDWHPAPDVLGAYADATATSVQADSVEAHLLRCERCRSELGSLVVGGGDATTDAVWLAITDRIDRPSASGRPGSWWLKVTFGSPLLWVATLALAAALLVVPLVVSLVDPTAGVTVLLALAPLAPVVGALLAYRPEIDPAGAMTAATPLATATLVLTRAAVVAGSALPAALVAAVLLPARLELLVGWLLPGLALSLVVLAAGTRTDPSRLAATLAVVWAAAVTVAGTRLRHVPLEDMLDQLFVNQLATQLMFLTVALVAAGTVTLRRDHLAWSLR